MDILEELKARDERIEKLERALLLMLSLNIGNHLDKSTKNCFSHVQTFAVEQMEILVAEGGSTKKVIEDLLAASGKHFRDELAILGRTPPSSRTAKRHSNYCAFKGLLILIIHHIGYRRGIL